ncbi:MAG: TetR/AcrR family transcriptional regulator [Chloroflexota bacterium]
MSQKDMRVRRSHKLIRESFLALLIEKDFEAITVQDIADRAMVNRATFYRHYQDKYDLVVRITDDMLYTLLEQMEPPPVDVDNFTLGQPPVAWIQLFAYLQEHALLYRLLLTQSGMHQHQLNKHFHRLIDKQIEQRLQIMWESSQQPRVPFEVIVGYCSSAFLGALIWWLDNGTPYTPQQMASWVQQLMVPGTFYALGLDLPIS